MHHFRPKFTGRGRRRKENVTYGTNSSKNCLIVIILRVIFGVRLTYVFICVYYILKEHTLLITTKVNSKMQCYALNECVSRIMQLASIEYFLHFGGLMTQSYKSSISFLITKKNFIVISSTV